KETEYEEYYRNLYKDSALENKIIFRSGPHLSSYLPGMDFSDNAKALFEYMLKNNYNEKYELIWFVKNPDEYQEYTANKNVSFIALKWSVSDEKEKRDAYYRALCLAKYIFFTDAYGIARNCRADQIRVQLWHGCGFKTRLNFSPCSKRYEYMTVTSELYADIHSKVFGLQRSQLLITGCAKEDWLFQTEEMDYFKELHIPNADKYIFWLPTYRKADDVLAQRNGYELNQETGLPIVDTQEKVKLLNTFLAEKGIVLVIKLHPYQNREKIVLDSCSNIILLDNGQLNQLGIHINHLLGRADALISDYSSAAVDYLLLDRPIAFMLDDVEEYESSRGFVFDNIRDWLPGEEIFSFDDLLIYLEDIAEGKDSSRKKRHVLTKRMHANCDGNNCRRIVEALGIA
ncbi:MAG: CDP-glycerol glycerophosphotransferase family protein, partial [Lachnospiraceae bacterium]|nr:CDP-glycerol glycerophosphotransferase family protein [Lachnospiraceae bacterium]